MFDTILVPVDGSDHAMKAVDTATNLASKYGSRLVVLSVYKHHSQLESTHSLVRTREEIEPPDATLKTLAQEVVDAAAARAKKNGAKQIETLVKRGQPARTIVQVAKQRGADAVIMGSRGLGDVGGFLLGSVSHKVSSLAECTCITVK
jgi:nucleotide-binding universal stress UspA family protein